MRNDGLATRASSANCQPVRRAREKSDKLMRAEINVLMDASLLWPSRILVARKVKSKHLFKSNKPQF